MMGHGLYAAQGRLWGQEGLIINEKVKGLMDQGISKSKICWIGSTKMDKLE